MSKLIVTYLGHEMDGIIRLAINGKPYTYRVDAADIQDYVNWLPHMPGKTLNKIKARCFWWVDPKGILHEN
jgi:hypothetical protein